MLKRIVFLSLILSFTAPALAAGQADLDKTAQKLTQAIFNKNEAAAKAISSTDFWNRQSDSMKDFYTQMVQTNEKTGGDLSLVSKNLGVDSDRGVVQLDIVQKSTGKIGDTVYLFAKIDGDMWVFIGMNENQTDVQAFLKGSVPAGFK